MNDEKKKKYTVGYGMPPIDTQFKPGKSGNPKGRPKGAVPRLNLVVAAALAETVTFYENGKKRRITMLEALIKKQLAKAINGDVKAAGQIFKLIPAAEADATAEFHAIQSARTAAAIKTAQASIARLVEKERLAEASGNGGEK